MLQIVTAAMKLRHLLLVRKAVTNLKSESTSVVSTSLQPHELYSPWNSLGQNTGLGSPSILQRISNPRIFPT